MRYDRNLFAVSQIISRGAVKVNRVLCKLE
jgi:hypothetical protein